MVSISYVVGEEVKQASRVSNDIHRENGKRERAVHAAARDAFLPRARNDGCSSYRRASSDTSLLRSRDGGCGFAVVGSGKMAAEDTRCTGGGT